MKLPLVDWPIEVLAISLPGSHMTQKSVCLIDVSKIMSVEKSAYVASLKQYSGISICLPFSSSVSKGKEAFSVGIKLIGLAPQ
jgi:hypothetical protein